MRFNSVVLLVGCALFAAVCNSSAAASKVTFQKPIDGQQVKPRFLRIDTSDGTNEARAFSLLGMDKLKQITKAGASKITYKVQIQKMRVQGKTADEALVVFQLDKAGENLLNNPQFKSWFTYVTKINKQHPKTAMLASLKTRYTDEALAKMFEAAKKVPATQSMATKLQVAQMREWVRNGKSTDDVLELLKLDDGLETLLTNPSLNILASYVNQFNKLNPGKETTLVSTMMVSYGDEAVAKMLEAAKKVPNTEKLAKELQTAQFQQWLLEGAKPAQIWKMLKMEKSTWMTNPDADVWRGYLAFYKASK